MITDLLKHRRGTSPQMLAISAGIHLLALALIIVGAKYFKISPKVSDSGITTVKLVESRPITQGAIEQLQTTPVDQVSPVSSPEPKEPVRNTSPEPEQLKTVFAKAEPSTPVIQMKKRKQNPDKIEVKKKPLEAKPKTDKAKNETEKKANPSDFLEKRLAAIKKDLENKKPDTGKKQGDKGLETPAGAGSRGAANGSPGDAEISRWFDAVRNRINSRWSVIGDEQRSPKVTIISVQLSDDGRLIEASIDNSSGDRLFDSSAMRAIHQAAPYPPMSTEVSERIRAAGGLALRFTPGGLQ